MTDQKHDVGGYFNRIAKNYTKKYSGDDAFLHYFFNERLAEATRGIDIKGKKILDIGAGTGNLYDHLLLIDADIDYYAVDIAEDMLLQSNIPSDRRFVGQADELELPSTDFDLVYLLGVTTYFDDARFLEILDWIVDNLAVDGRAVITFTNKSSGDWRSRKMLKTVAKRILPKSYVLAQSFQIFPRSIREVKEMTGSAFEIEEIRWLNHTVFPLNQLLKRPSVSVARRIHNLRRDGVMKLLSSDFLVVLRRR